MPEVGRDRDDAIARGLNRYHGLACVHGHGTVRYVRSEKCCVCISGDYNSRNREAGFKALEKLNRPDLPAVRQAMLCGTTESYVVRWLELRRNGCVG
jgi:hypothetical protein